MRPCEACGRETTNPTRCKVRYCDACHPAWVEIKYDKSSHAEWFIADDEERERDRIDYGEYREQHKKKTYYEDIEGDE